MLFTGVLCVGYRVKVYLARSNIVNRFVRARLRTLEVCAAFGNEFRVSVARGSQSSGVYELSVTFRFALGVFFETEFNGFTFGYRESIFVLGFVRADFKPVLFRKVMFPAFLRADICTLDIDVKRIRRLNVL